MRVQREAERAVVLDHLLALRHGRQRHRRLPPLAALIRGLEERQRRRLGQRAGLPQRLTPIESHRAEGVRPRQGLDGGGRDPGAAGERADIGIRRAARVHDACRVLLAQAAHLTQAEAECTALRAAPLPRVFQAVVPPARVDIHRAHFDAVLARIPHDLGGGVEAHGLGVQERAGEGVGVVALEP